MYDINKHKHNYAVWAASRAWGRGLPGGKYALAKSLINVANLESVRCPDDIGPDVDLWLLHKMRLIIDHAAMNHIVGINYGRVQKLVNIYLKTKLVCGGYECHPKVGLLHPPIDRRLLDGLRKALRNQNDSDAAKAFKSAQIENPSWTCFDLNDYLSHIAAIKLYMGNKPLWMVEKHWE